MADKSEPEMLDLRYRRDGYIRDGWEALIDPDDGEVLRATLVDAIRRDGWHDPERELPKSTLQWRRRVAYSGGWQTFTASEEEE